MGVQVHMGSTLAMPRRARPTSKPKGRRPSQSLTPVESDILALLVQGYTVKEIAHMRQRTVPTVNMELRYARKRTGSKTTFQLCAWYAAKSLASEVIPA